jgi:hypothetical protein
MSNSNRDPRRRILDEFGADDEIVGIDINYSLDDLKLFLPTMGLALVIVAGASNLGGTVAMLGGVIGAVGMFLVTAAIIYITPNHLTPQRWLLRIAGFLRREKTKTAVGSTPSKQTETLTQVARFVPESDSLERLDGQVVAAVRIEPANMALATNEEWNAAADAFGSALNTLEFPFQMHSSARSVAPEQITASYRDRLDDPDVAANESLEEIIDVYQTRLPAEFRTRGTSVREYHVLVPVSVRDVQLAERGALGKLESLPYVGGLLAAVGAESTGLSEVEIESHQQETLDTRLDDVRSAIRGLDECDCEVVPADRLATLIEEFWTGRRTEYDQSSQRVRSVPIVTAGDASRRACACR